MKIPEVKIGQIYKNQNGENFLLLDIGEKYYKFQCLQETEEYFVGEILPWVTKDQLKNLILVEELQYTEELKYEVKLKEINSDIKRYKRNIETLQHKMEQCVDEYSKYLNEYYILNPEKAGEFWKGLK